jgi:hypothetical protein
MRDIPPKRSVFWLAVASSLHYDAVLWIDVDLNDG